MHRNNNACLVEGVRVTVPIMAGAKASPGVCYKKINPHEYMIMRISTLDPISMHGAHNLDSAPYVIEGTRPNALKIYFENDANKAEYFDKPEPTGNSTITAA